MEVAKKVWASHINNEDVWDPVRLKSGHRLNFRKSAATQAKKTGSGHIRYGYCSYSFGMLVSLRVTGISPAMGRKARVSFDERLVRFPMLVTSKEHNTSRKTFIEKACKHYSKPDK